MIFVLAGFVDELELLSQAVLPYPPIQALEPAILGDGQLELCATGLFSCKMLRQIISPRLPSSAFSTTLTEAYLSGGGWLRVTPARTRSTLRPHAGSILECQQMSATGVIRPLDGRDISGSIH